MRFNNKNIILMTHLSNSHVSILPGYIINHYREEGIAAIILIFLVYFIQKSIERKALKSSKPVIQTDLGALVLNNPKQNLWSQITHQSESIFNINNNGRFKYILL